jgi:hypothetical protein
MINGSFSVIRRIYIYDTKAGHFKIIASKNKIIKSFSTKIPYTFKQQRRPFEVESGKAGGFNNPF